MKDTKLHRLSVIKCFMEGVKFLIKTLMTFFWDTLYKKGKCREVKLFARSSSIGHLRGSFCCTIRPAFSTQYLYFSCDVFSQGKFKISKTQMVIKNEPIYIKTSPMALNDRKYQLGKLEIIELYIFGIIGKIW